jgi:hypothetical protein
MKILCGLLILLFCVQNDPENSTRKLPEAGLEFQLPGKEWDKEKRELVGSVVLYNFKRQPITDSLNQGIIANISILIEDAEPGLNAATYSLMKRSKVPFKIDKTFTWNSGLLNYRTSVGYLGSYSDKAGLLHRIVVVHALRGRKGIQMICDATDSVWPAVQPEFMAAVKSLAKILPAKESKK